MGRNEFFVESYFQCCLVSERVDRAFRVRPEFGRCMSISHPLLEWLLIANARPC